MIDVSIVLPALSINNDLFRCIYSIRSAFFGRLDFEIICVVPDLKSFSNFESEDLRFINEDGPGIYSAMNLGARMAKGRYLYFCGQDDIVLPAASDALLQGLTASADIILGDVFWGDRKVFKNQPCPHVLAWRNWCHQGIFYDRSKFMSTVGAYPVQYKVQADHYANIVIGSRPESRIEKYNSCIAWYASDGFSSRAVDLTFRSDFPLIVKKYLGTGQFVMVVFRRFFLQLLRRSKA